MIYFESNNQMIHVVYQGNMSIQLELKTLKNLSFQLYNFLFLNLIVSNITHYLRNRKGLHFLNLACNEYASKSNW